MILSNSIFDYTHDQGEPLSIQAGSLSSRKGIIPYGYTKLKICDSQKVIKAEDTLGEILTGEVYIPLIILLIQTKMNIVKFFAIIISMKKR